MIKEKFAKIVVNVAVREWPQRWPTFTDSLIAVIENNRREMDVALIIFRILCEEITVFNENWDDSRRNELKSALNAVMPSMFPLLVSVLGSLSLFSNQIDGFSPEESLYLSIILMKNFGVLLEWLSPNILSEYPSFVPLICKAVFINNKEISIHSCDCMFLLCSRGWKPSEKSLLDPIIDLSPHVSEFLRSTSLEHYEMQKKLSQVYSTLAIRQICQKKHPYIPKQGFELFLSVALLGFLHPSLLISSLFCPFWQTSFKIDMISSNSSFIATFPYLIEEIFKKLTVNLLKLKSPYTREDFDDKVEYGYFIGSYHGYLAEILKHVSAAKTVETLQFIGGKIALTMQKCQNVLQDAHFEEWNYLISFLEICSKGITVLNGDLKQCVAQFISSFLAIQTKVKFH